MEICHLLIVIIHGKVVLLYNKHQYAPILAIHGSWWKIKYHFYDIMKVNFGISGLSKNKNSAWLQFPSFYQYKIVQLGLVGSV